MALSNCTKVSGINVTGNLTTSPGSTEVYTISATTGSNPKKLYVVAEGGEVLSDPAVSPVTIRWNANYKIKVFGENCLDGCCDGYTAVQDFNVNVNNTYSQEPVIVSDCFDKTTLFIKGTGRVGSTIRVYDKDKYLLKSFTIQTVDFSFFLDYPVELVYITQTEPNKLESKNSNIILKCNC